MDLVGAPTRLATLLVVAALGFAACGGDDGQPQAAAADGSSGGETVSVASVDGVGEVLVDADGAALYSPDQEADGTIACTGKCAAIWVPLTLPRGMKTPSGSSEVEGKLGTVERPDGSVQVTLDRRPLYSFTEDNGPGEVNGDGFADSFAGQDFTWSVVTVGGAEEDGQSGGNMGGGYSY
jgi:predicted lipoprotein with Yx(FWY)xxD motif